MIQNKKVIGIGLGTVVVLLLIAGGLIFGLKHYGRQMVNDGAVSLNTDVASQQQQAVTSNPSLSVGSVGSAPTAQNLGQLNVGQNSSTSTATGSNSSSTGGSSAPQAPDPSTFAQYEKYKNSPHALFGDVQVGSGAALGANQKAAVYYKGWLTNGTMFDESRVGADGKIQPFVFTLGAHQVIPGWEEAINGMKVGGTRLMIIPPAVGYGSQAQSNIPANSVLIFEVQLLEVQ